MEHELPRGPEREHRVRYRAPLEQRNNPPSLSCALLCHPCGLLMCRLAWMFSAPRKPIVAALSAKEDIAPSRFSRNIGTRTRTHLVDKTDTRGGGQGSLPGNTLFTEIRPVELPLYTYWSCQSLFLDTHVNNGAFRSYVNTIIQRSYPRTEFKLRLKASYPGVVYCTYFYIPIFFRRTIKQSTL